MSEEACARLCLLTRAAWSEGLPPPLTRGAVCRMIRFGALKDLVLRSVPEIDEQTMARARLLLSRAQAVFALMQAYEEQGYRILLPDGPQWPAGLSALKTGMPLFLFAMGNMALLRKPRLALAGSREIEPKTWEKARAIGRQMAQEGIVMVSGGARGVDGAAQQGLLNAGGELILVPAQTAKAQLARIENRQALEEGRLLLLCDTLPDEPFSPQKALLRNHTIYAMGEAALVVASRDGIGGSWHGAIDCIKGEYSTVYVADGDGKDFLGNRALLQRGACPLPEKFDLTALLQTEKQIKWDITN